MDFKGKSSLESIQLLKRLPAHFPTIQFWDVIYQ